MGRRVPLRALTLAAAPLVVGLLTFMAIQTMDGAESSVAVLGGVVFGLAVASTIGVLLLPRLGAQSSSLRRTVLAAGITAMVITGLAITASSAAVMLVPPQLGVMVVLFLFGASLGVILEFSLARSLSRDLHRLGSAARQIARGDYGARAELDRLDEIGESGRVIDRIPQGHGDLSEMTDEAVEALSPVARLKDVRIRLDTSGHVYTSGGPAQLSRSLRNLLDNAIRHTPAGSEVTVLVRDQDGPLVCVIDRGPGLSGRDA